MRKTFGLLGLVVALAGCGSLDALRAADRGPGAELDVERLRRDATAEDHRVSLIAVRAGLSQPPEQWGRPEWRRFGQAAFTVAQRECDEYLDALRRAEILRRATARQLNILATSSAAFLGIGQVAAATVAATATAFGLVTATADNLIGSLVYALPANAVRGLVESSRARFEAALGDDDWNDRSQAFRNIAQYVSYCLPVVIEANAAATVGAPSIEVTRRAGGAPPQLQFGAATAGARDGVPGTAGASGPKTPVAPAAPLPTPVAGTRGEDEARLLTAALVASIRANLCLPRSSTVNMDATDLRGAIADWRSQNGSTQTGGLTGGEISGLIGIGRCVAGFQTRFEMISFRSADDVTPVAGRLRRLNLLLATEQPIQINDPVLRRAIQAFNRANGLGEGTGMTAQGFRKLRELTPDPNPKTAHDHEVPR